MKAHAHITFEFADEITNWIVDWALNCAIRTMYTNKNTQKSKFGDQTKRKTQNWNVNGII